MTIELELKEVAVSYDDHTVIDKVSLSLGSGEIGCLLGPSGCGKTSLLRAIAGFEPVSHGEIALHDRIVSRQGHTLPTEQRRIGMVFQDVALFPHLNVAKNVAFGLRHLTAKEREQRITELLQLVGLEHLRNAPPHQLSGGQQQRIALIRAMAPRPDILLLDEPFSGLDAELSEQLAHEVRELLKQDAITTILVTHDQLEAFAMADIIGVVGNGKLHQWENGYHIYHNPADRFVADFIGQGVMLPGKVVDQRRVETELGIIEGELQNGSEPGSRIELLLRPDDVIHDDGSDIRLKVTAKAFRGAEYLYTLSLPSGQSIICLVQSHHDHLIGEHIGIKIEADDLPQFPMK
ncbi:MAG: ABC transporter ATP-binding protein [Candidatus Sedimenticola sp. (ex Thyasira tokunagai)]